MATKSTAKKEVTESVKKAPVKKAAPAKAPLVEEVYVQFGGEEWKVADLTERAKAAYLAEGHRASGIKKLRKARRGQGLLRRQRQGQRQRGSVTAGVPYGPYISEKPAANGCRLLFWIAALSCTLRLCSLCTNMYGAIFVQNRF